ncbi:MAG TPA: hypothetical protein VGI12_15060 [Vicinamibacterales bacterium]
MFRNPGSRVLLVLIAAAATASAGSGAADTPEAWLTAHPAVARRLVWTAGDGRPQRLGDWSPEMRRRFDSFYAGIAAHAPDLHMRLLDPAKGKHQRIPADVAFDLYAAHAAHVIYVEAHHLVPWSIADRPAVEVDRLLASTGYVARLKPTSRTYPDGIEANRDFQDLPENIALGEYLSDPRIGFDFVTGKTSASGRSLVGRTELDTLRNLTAWLRDNVNHGPLNDPDKDARARQLAWLDDRLRMLPGTQTAMANEGCHSAAKLLVDLARSVNIPLLSTRALDDASGVKDNSFLSRTHAGLVYGWGGPSPRVLWHADDIYARDGRTFFPIDEHTHARLSPVEADQRYFDAVWFTPADLAGQGFVYHLEPAIPGQGHARDANDARQSNDLYDFGIMSGYWKGMGRKGAPSQLLNWYYDYILDGDPLLNLAARHVVKAQLTTTFAKYKGELSDDERPRVPDIEAFERRAAEALDALGGASAYQALAVQAKTARGGNLLTAAVSYGARR